MSLDEYVTTRTYVCERSHKNPCMTCKPLLTIAKQIIDIGHMQLSLAHANLFIPSTLSGGLPLNPDTGNVDEEILCSNLNKAADVYINRVDKCPCGDTVINLYKGSDSSQYQSMRKHLQVFLKGSQKKKERRMSCK